MNRSKCNKVFTASVAALLFALSIASAEACSVCGVGKEEARGAYYATTAVLSFLPLVMIGGIVYFIFKHSKK